MISLQKLALVACLTLLCHVSVTAVPLVVVDTVYGNLYQELLYLKKVVRNALQTTHIPDVYQDDTSNVFGVKSSSWAHHSTEYTTYPGNSDSFQNAQQHTELSSENKYSGSQIWNQDHYYSDFNSQNASHDLTAL